MLYISRLTFKAVGKLRGIEGTDVYCHRNCLRYPSKCPKDVCKCNYVKPTGEAVADIDDEDLAGLVVDNDDSEDDEDKD